MKILIGFSVFALICLVLVVLESWRENRKVKVTHYEYSDFPLRNWNGTNIMLLTDLHNCVYGRENVALLSLVKKENPDIILIAGDMLVGKPKTDFKEAVHFLTQLAEMDIPIYYAHGNHELRLKLYPEQYGDMYERFRKELSPKINFLLNESVCLDKNGEKIKIFGLDMDKKYYQRFKKTPMDENYLADIWNEDQSFRILIAHNPLYFKEYAESGADMVVSGHYHGCMVRIPFLGGILSPQIGFFPKYVAGEYREKNSIMYLSAGLGNHSIKLRIGNIPEVVVITFTA